MNPGVLVISCSLNPESRSRRLAEEAVRSLKRMAEPVEFVDLRDFDLPLCDGHSRLTPPARQLQEKIAAASAVLLAAPIYNYDVNAVAKNLVELTGGAWKGKPVGFITTAGGKSSYMSPIGLANSLIFDFRCWIIPRFVYSTSADFGPNDSVSPECRTRVEQLARTAVDVARALPEVGRPGAASAA